jgi:recombinational DNA repair protein (RecF pathway)
VSYKTYITDAVVCGSYPHNTSDKAFLIFTREAGMIYATAKSVREERSKHRYALQECSRIRATLVRGRSGWKITGAESMTNFYNVARTREARALTRDTLRLLRRLVHGEEPHVQLFDGVVSILEPCEEGYETPHYLIGALRMLMALGYVANTPLVSVVCDIRTPLRELYAYVRTHETALRTAIERALTESHL